MQFFNVALVFGVLAIASAYSQAVSILISNSAIVNYYASKWNYISQIKWA
jgi:hypothetical protein